MPNTLLDYDPNDTGDIPLQIPGEDRTVIIRTDIGETTQNLGQYFRPDVPFDAIPRRTIELDDTVTYMPATIGIVDRAAAQPIAPLERVADETAVHTILDSLAGAQAGIDGELTSPSGPSTPPPTPPRPAAPGKGRGYVGRHRQAVQGTSWWPLVGLVAGAVIALSGLLVMH